MALLLHICKRYDNTRTLCDLKSARVAAVDFSDRKRIQPEYLGDLCPVCEDSYATITKQERSEA